ncbi:MAG: right-handed parallel beta-helix repeat-containing protein [Angelakisella sp.]
MKKLLSVVLALLMLAVMLPVTAMAEDTNYCTIEGITEADGTTLKHFGTLTAAAKAWRESNGIATTGGNMGGHPENLTSVDSISWVISGSVGTGDGTGVVGTSGSLLSGGYIYPSIAINNVYIRGVNNAELKNELGSDDYALTAGGKNVVYDGITFPEYVSFNFGAENVTFKNCTFKGGLKVMQAINVTVDNCKFEGDGSKDFAFFAQSVPANSMKAVQFKNNTVSSFMRGINVQADSTATVSITGNTITNLTGYTKNDQTYGAAIQLTTGREFIITNNKIDVNTGNAFRFYSGLDADVTISDNIIKAPYLVWNQAELPNEKITSQDNKLTITNPNKAATSDGALEDATVIKAAPTTIVIITPAGDTPKTEDQKNPTTGANDMVAAAAALMAVSALGMAVLSRKK